MQYNHTVNPSHLFINHKRNVEFFHVGLPVILVGISAAIRPGGYGNEKNCWISTEDGLIWAFVGPVLLIILVKRDFLYRFISYIVKL